ncbi:EcsC family protein [Metabacillus sp. RGM 3146]|uniref:EcsC family protein n=1 Tax=Metabacillus sp. RGM 3146 TaxID=3401092 RepID=UPI003B9B9254
MEYEERVRQELLDWKKKLEKRSSIFERTSKNFQDKLQVFVPEKADHAITIGIKKMVEMTLAGSMAITRTKDPGKKPLQERDQSARNLISFFQKTAALEGAGTGGAGFWLGAADFPLLLGLQMKYLFETAEAYGYATKEKSERVFLLYVFHLAYAEEKDRKMLLEKIENWDVNPAQMNEIDWKSFQKAYRDHIDFVKMLQLLPGFGTIVGGVANHHLITRLGSFAMNAFRLRMLNNEEMEKKR